MGKQVTVGKKQAAMFSGWSFYQLQRFIRYKAESLGVAVVFIDPRHTSQCCSKCFHIEWVIADPNPNSAAAGVITPNTRIINSERSRTGLDDSYTRLKGRSSGDKNCTFRS
jgi:hypothetical protein